MYNVQNFQPINKTNTFIIKNDKLSSQDDFSRKYHESAVPYIKHNKTGSKSAQCCKDIRSLSDLVDFNNEVF